MKIKPAVAKGDSNLSKDFEVGKYKRFLVNQFPFAGAKQLTIFSLYQKGLKELLRRLKKKKAKQFNTWNASKW